MLSITIAFILGILCGVIIETTYIVNPSLIPIIIIFTVGIEIVAWKIASSLEKYHKKKIEDSWSFKNHF